MSKSIIAAIIAAFLIGGSVSYKLTDSHWQGKWDARDIADKNAEIAYQQKIKSQSDQAQADRDNIANEAKVKNDELEKQLAASRADTGGLLNTIAKLRQEREIELSTTTGTVSTSSDPYLLQSNLLESSISTNQNLAGYADELRNRLESCNKQYQSITK